MARESMLEHLTLDDSCVERRSSTATIVTSFHVSTHPANGIPCFHSFRAVIERVIRDGQSSSSHLSRLIFRFLITSLLYLPLSTIRV